MKSAPVKGALIGYDFLHNDYWLFWANYEGQTAYDPYTGSSGGYFTPARLPVIYTEGLLWGGFLRGIPAESDTPRVGGISYRIGTDPGGIIRIDDHLEVNELSKGIFKVHKNWQNLSNQYFKRELSISLHKQEDEITDYDVNSIRKRYAKNWKEWPVQWGAPFNDVNDNGIYDPVIDEQGYPQIDQGDYPGIAGADETLFMVVNDLNEARVKAHTGTLPVGVELQITLWNYQNTFWPLSSAVFKRYVLINKSNATIDSMYFQLFADPDVGDYSDDLVGCDSTLSLAFAYNGRAYDAEAQEAGVSIPPVISLALLQGPLVESPGSTGRFNFKQVADKKNLPMTSFAYLQSFSCPMCDPPMGVIDYALQTYNMMRGFIPTNDLKHPTPFIAGSGPRAGLSTRFPLSGDPVNDPTGLYGDVDGQGQNLSPGDRRFYMNTGPFRMEPGERQEIIAIWIGAIGKDERQGITWIKEFLKIIQQFYENGFKDMDLSPAAPQVRAETIGKTVLLNWGWNPQSIEEIEQKEKNGFRFEGYNVYQLPDSNATIRDPRTVKLVTFDLNNSVKTIDGLTHNIKSGNTFLGPLQIGRDSGIQRYFVVKRDSINHKPLYKGSTYYFVVTSYNYNQEFKDFPSLESDYQVVAVTIQGKKPGLRYQAEPEEFIETTASQKTDVICQVKVVDPTLVTDHNYQLTFTSVPDSIDSLQKQWFWNLEDLSTGKMLLKNKPVLIFKDDQNLDNLGNDIELVDGLLIKVFAPEPDIKAIMQVADAEGPLTPDEYDEQGAPFKGNNVWHDRSSPNDENPFYISAGGGSGGLDRITPSIENARGHDFELRFTEQGGIYAWWYDEDIYVDVPFEAWDVGRATYDDASDDIRCLTGGYSGGATVGVFDYEYKDPFLGFPATDWLYIRVPIDSRGSYKVFYDDVTSGNFNYQWWSYSKEVLARIIICDMGGAKTLPPTGTVIRFITTKGPTEDLVFNFQGPGEPIQSNDLLKKDVEKINVFPNPYYAASSMEPDRFTHFVTFNYLPPHAIIRIFTLNGALVRKLEKNDPSQFFRWDLKNEKGWRVASGLYIVHIEMPELNKQKILKLMVITGEEVLEYY
ncbi:MAG: T9SS type A sorting domain-containing protein [Caldisericaceae bacterium]|nr:T9SS type A sorting domain-containing protein [Caldisericaceae bacterium]